MDWRSNNKVRILDIDGIIIFYKNINGRKENRNQRISKNRCYPLSHALDGGNRQGKALRSPLVFAQLHEQADP